MLHSHLNDMEIPETKRFIPKGFELGTTLSKLNRYIETVCCIVMASCYEESSNFSPVVTFKFEIDKNHKRNWIKTFLFTG